MLPYPERDVAALGEAHPQFQVGARGTTGQPVAAWYARPWSARDGQWWDGSGAVASAATAGDLDRLLSKLEQDG